MRINDLVIGSIYSNDEIMSAFGCGNVGGMRRSRSTNTLVLIYNHTQMYDDAWKGNILHYTGMGKRGDQSLHGNQNITLYESNTNGVKLHLFEAYHRGEYTYRGQVKLAGEPYQEIQKDADGNSRKVWMFPLIRK